MRVADLTEKRMDFISSQSENPFIERHSGRLCVSCADLPTYLVNGIRLIKENVNSVWLNEHKDEIVDALFSSTNSRKEERDTK